MMDEMDALEVGEKLPEAPREQLPNTQNYVKAVIKESKAEPAVLLEN